MQRSPILAWATRPVVVLLALALILSSCMSLRHKVDPVSITLNVKLENVDAENQAEGKPGPAAAAGALKDRSPP